MSNGNGASAKSAWKGTLRLGLVNVPVRMFNVADPPERTTRHQLHAHCNQRIKMKRFCPACNEEAEAIVKGFEHAKGQYVIISDEEVKTVVDAPTSVLDVRVITDDHVDPAYIEATGYLVPDGTVGAQSFETLRVALGQKLAVGEMVFRGRSVLVALEAKPAGFLVYVLRGYDQVRTLDDLNPVSTAAPSKSDLALAKQLLSVMDGKLEYRATRDEYAVRFKELVGAKLRGETIAAAEPPKATEQSLADALKQSLLLSSKKPAKAKLEVVPTPAKKRAAR